MKVLALSHFRDLRRMNSLSLSLSLSVSVIILRKYTSCDKFGGVRKFSFLISPALNFGQRRKYICILYIKQSLP